jgi:hypothetical protein
LSNVPQRFYETGESSFPSVFIPENLAFDLTEMSYPKYHDFRKIQKLSHPKTKIL